MIKARGGESRKGFALKIPNPKFSAFAFSFGATASKRSEDGQAPEKSEVPSER
jgi:hypothetical protein